VYSFAALMKKNEIESLPPNQPLPPKYQLMIMAKEISDSKPGGNGNNQSKGGDHTIYKTTITNTAPIHPSQATQTNIPNDNPYVNPYNGSHLNGILQGATREQYIANQTYRPGRKDFKPRRKPVPDPAKESPEKRRSLFDASIICDACHMIGHPACRCHTLAAAIFVFKYLEDKANDEDCKKALEYWDERNRSRLRDPKTSKVGTLTPMQVLRTYQERYGHSLETMDNDLDWMHFERENSDENDCIDAFGVDWSVQKDLHSE
jgi:hypothetical protein